MRKIIHLTFIIVFIGFEAPVVAQDNSPYSRYGLGDIVPSTNIDMRAMGGISSSYDDPYGFSINFSNPASYGSFYTYRGPKAKKLTYGRAILDVGINIENRSLIQPNVVGKFTASNFLVSHAFVGVPLKQNWGLVFGIRPLTRISYKINQGSRVVDAVSGLPTEDSTNTQSTGDGGAFLPTIGTGFKIGKYLSIGVNAGYLFGRKDYSSRKTIINDTVLFNSGNFETTTSYGNLYFNAGLQYQIKVDSVTYITLGAYGNMRQKLNATQNLIRETFFYDANQGNVRIDSVYEKSKVKGDIEYPSSYTAGITINHFLGTKTSGWTLSVDYSKTNWSEYSFYGQPDSVQDAWKIHVGGEIRPAFESARKSYWGNVAYRVGFFLGPDYVKVHGKLPVFGASLGAALPLRNFNRLNNQVSVINVALEYVKRGNNDNLLKENLFRVSFGLSLSDLWFSKKKYE